MTRFVASQLRFRHGRALALAGGILVAGVAFTILTASAHTAAFRTRGTISRNYRTAYDILVRPHGSTTPLEGRDGLVRDNYLSGIYGGISFPTLRRAVRRQPDGTTEPEPALVTIDISEIRVESRESPTG